VFGILFSPVAWLLGVPGNDIIAVGQMLGEKTILNEFFAYVTLTDMKNGGEIGPKSIIISTYALCGFANFASIGIQIGGIGAIAPGQRINLSQLGVRALIGGTIACLFTATIAGVLVREL
jgi:concentrative nucleoside transporter, CNT family